MRLKLVVMGATGKLELPALAAAGLPAAAVNPRQARDFAKATGRLAKAEAIEAAALAHFARAIRLEARPLPDAATRERQGLPGRRRRLIGKRAMSATRPATAGRALRDVEAHPRWLGRRLTGVGEEPGRLDRASPPWRGRDDLLRGIPGIGPMASRTLPAGRPGLRG